MSSCEPIGLTESDLEIFTELMNIGFGRAAARVGALFDRFVKMGIPSVTEVSVENLPVALAKAVPGTEVLVHQGFGPTFRGEALVALGGGADLPGLLGLPEEEHASEEALLELANIIVGAAIGTLSELLRSEVWFSPPRLHKATMLQSEHRTDQFSYAILITTSFQVEDAQVQGGLALVIPDGGLIWLSQALQEFAEAL